MTAIKTGDTVRFFYTGKLNDGTVFSSTSETEPLTVTVGEGQIIPGIEQALPGMTEGESKTVHIPCEEAFGVRQPEKMQAVDRQQIPDDIPLEIGTRLQLQSREGAPVQVTVAEVTETEVILDTNHPLAGQDLTFALEVVEIV